MSNVIKPRISDPHTGRAVSGDEAWSERLVKYIPLPIAGAYPVLENALQSYQKQAGLHLPIPTFWLVVIVFWLLVLWSWLDLHKQYNKAGVSGPARWRLEVFQGAVVLVAFAIWTYSIHGLVWGDLYNAGLAMVLVVLFLLFADYAPKISPEEAKASGFAAYNMRR